MDDLRVYMISDSHYTGISCSCCNCARAMRKRTPKAKEKAEDNTNLADRR